MAFLNKGDANAPMLARFARDLALALTAVLAVMALSPLGDWIFAVIMKAPASILPATNACFLALLLYPATTVWFVWSRARLAQKRNTRPIAIATVLETGLLAGGLALLVGPIGMTGATAAGVAVVGARIIANLWLERSASAAFRPA